MGLQDPDDILLQVLAADFMHIFFLSFFLFFCLETMTIFALLCCIIADYGSFSIPQFVEKAWSPPLNLHQKDRQKDFRLPLCLDLI